MTTDPKLCYGCFLYPSGAETCPCCSYAARQNTFTSALTAGSKLGKYIVGRVLGQPGGFGITYLAFDTVLARRIALKELMPRDVVVRRPDGMTVRPYTSVDDEVFTSIRRSFFAEAKLLAQLDHPNVVRVLDYFEANGTGYFTMEYYDGCTLHERVSSSGGRLSGPESVELILQVLEALHELHSREQPILHRDIKPSNIYLARTRPILIDFGAARISLRERSRPLSAVFTPGFAPYEQYSPDGNQGPWSDIYGCAATLHFLVTGRAPPPARAGLKAPRVADVQRLVPELEPRLARAIVTGLSFHPDGRPKSAHEFSTLLKQSFADPEESRVTPAAEARETGMSTRIALRSVRGRHSPRDPAGSRRSATAPEAMQGGRSSSPRGWFTRIDRAARVAENLKKWIVAVVGMLGLVASAATAIMHSDSVVATPAKPSISSASEPTSAMRPPEPPGSADVERRDAEGGSNSIPAAAPGSISDHSPGTGPRPNSAAADPSGEAAAVPPGILVLVSGLDERDERFVTTAVLRSLSNREDFRPLDPVGLSLDLPDAADAADWSALAAVARQRGAALLVVGVITSGAKPSFGRFFSGTAELDLRMYRLSTSSPVHAQTFRIGPPANEAPAALNEDQARFEAVMEVSARGATAVRRWVDTASP